LKRAFIHGWERLPQAPIGPLRRTLGRIGHNSMGKSA